MRFSGLMKKVGVIAGQATPEIIKLVDPPLGALVSSLINSVLLAEAKVGPGNGELKRSESLNAMQVAAPLLLRMVQTATGRKLEDPELLRSGLEKLNDGMVDVLNAFGFLPKRSKVDVDKAA